MSKRTKNTLILNGWILLAVFVFPFILKSIHVETHCDFCCEAHHEDAAENGKEHDASTCPICHFTVSLFTEPDIIHIPQVAYTLCTVPLFFTEEKPFSFVSSFYLRGPPL